jgi:uncharacterized protein (TIGR00251 family)
VIIQVHVTANAGRNELIKTDSSPAGYRAWVQCPPVDGKANKVLTELLAKEFNVSKSAIQIIRGKTARNKTVQIAK